MSMLGKGVIGPFFGGKLMKVQRRLFYFAVLLLLLGLVLTACERPVPGGGGDEAETAAEATADVNVGGGEPVMGETAVPQTDADAEPTPAPVEAGDSDTPRMEDATATPEPDAESETAVTDTEEPASDETDTEAADADTNTEETPAEETPAAEPAEETPQTHTVAAGENLYRIGLKYGISWVTLAEYNNLTNADKIKVGQVLNIPGGDAPEAEPTPSPLTETTYIVKAGDNLFRIGLQYNINWTQIAEANGIVNPNHLEVGQELKIPVDTPGPTPQFTHQVQAGETLFLISLRYGVAWTAIAEANEIGSPYVIYVGQTLVIPGGAAE